MKLDDAELDRLFDYAHAFDHLVTIVIVSVIVIGLMLARVLIHFLHRRERVDAEQFQELHVRWKSWCWLVALIVFPILLGRAFTMAAVAVLSLLCYREFARATGLFREKTISAIVVAGIVLLAFAAFDHYDRLFFAAAPLTVALIVVVTIPADRPQGFVQRTGLGVLGFVLFGFSLAYLGNTANVSDIGNGTDFRPILLLIVLGVEMNDIFAYCIGKTIGGPKWVPNTSPGKTVSGGFGALVVTTLMVVGIGYFVFDGTSMQRLDRLVTLGVIISGLGQLGDLMLSSIKRDVGIKDTGAVIPGHGGWLDRFDSLVLVPPAVYHYIALVLQPSAVGSDSFRQIITGG